MNTDVTKRRTPEEEELQKKRVELGALENLLAQHELDWATFQAQLNVFLTRYLSTVGLRLSQLDEINAEIAEVEARLRPQDNIAKDKADEARSRAKKSAEATQDIHGPGQPREFIPSDRLKALYWEVAKKITHPDLCTDESERVRRQQLMVEANQAYEQGDEERLQSILEEWRSSAEFITGEDVAMQLVRLIRKLANVRERISYITSRMTELRMSDLCALYERAKKAETEGKDLLKEVAEQVDVDIVRAKDRLRKLRLERSGT